MSGEGQNASFELHDAHGVGSFLPGTRRAGTWKFDVISEDEGRKEIGL